MTRGNGRFYLHINIRSPWGACHSSEVLAKHLRHRRHSATTVIILPSDWSLPGPVLTLFIGHFLQSKWALHWLPITPLRDS